MATHMVEPAAETAPPALMWAVVATGPGGPLVRIRVPLPRVGRNDVLLRVSACGICQLDAMLADGVLEGARYPVIPGHAVVGQVVEAGHQVRSLSAGDRVGVPRLGWACGRCPACLRGLEHLCGSARLTGQTHDGGMAEYVRADHRFCVVLPAGPPAGPLAPLLCEGAVAYRALRAVGEAHWIGLYGPAAATGLAADLARLRGREAIAMSEAGERATGLDAALVFAPATDLLRDALESVVDGGLVVWVSGAACDAAGVAVPLLSGERRIRSVAGATRRDLQDLLALAATSPIDPALVLFPMAAAEEALSRLRTGRAPASTVLV